MHRSVGDYGRDRERRWRDRVERAARNPSPVTGGGWPQRAARALGLSVEETKGNSVVFRGRVMFAVVDVVRTKRTAQTYNWVAAVARSGIPPSIVFDKESPLTRAKKVISGGDVEVGAPEFDEIVYVEGDPNAMVGALDETTRNVIADLVRRGGRIKDGTFTLQRRTNDPEAIPERLARDIRIAARVLKRLAADNDDTRRRLIRNARNEKNPDVRIANLDRLRRTYPDDIGRLDWRTDPALTRDVAWRSALMSSRTSVDDLARWAGDVELSMRDRAAFLERLEGRLPSSEALTWIEHFLHGPLGGAALRVLMKRIDHPTVVRDLRGPTLVALMTAGHTRDRIALARVLADVGRDDAITALLPYTSGFFMDDTLKDAARRAIARIEERNSRFRGMLSVTSDPEAGRLSVSNEAGDLSLAKD